MKLLCANIIELSNRNMMCCQLWCQMREVCNGISPTSVIWLYNQNRRLMSSWTEHETNKRGTKRCDWLIIAIRELFSNTVLMDKTFPSVPFSRYQWHQLVPSHNHAWEPDLLYCLKNWNGNSLNFHCKMFFKQWILCFKNSKFINILLHTNLKVKED